MPNKKVVLIAFTLIAVIQLFVPVKMIWDREDVLKTGKEFKFKTAPIDPTDPFRGKYITLQYEENTVEARDNEQKWQSGESIYVLIKNDEQGFAKIDSVCRNEPIHNQNYFKTEVWYATSGQPQQLTLNLPFDRYYMEESKAYQAELTYRQSQRDTSKVTYALVNIKEGQAVLKEVLINGVPIKAIVERNQEEGAK